MEVAVLGRVTLNLAALGTDGLLGYRQRFAFQAVVEHHVQSPHIGTAQPRILCFLYFPYPPVVFHVVVELLDNYIHDESKFLSDSAVAKRFIA